MHRDARHSPSNRYALESMKHEPRSVGTYPWLPSDLTLRLNTNLSLLCRPKLPILSLGSQWSWQTLRLWRGTHKDGSLEGYLPQIFREHPRCVSERQSFVSSFASSARLVFLSCRHHFLPGCNTTYTVSMPPRLLRPKDEPGASEDNELMSDLKTSRRKAVSTACIPCRKRKSKAGLLRSIKHSASIDSYANSATVASPRARPVRQYTEPNALTMRTATTGGRERSNVTSNHCNSRMMPWMSSWPRCAAYRRTSRSHSSTT